VTAVPIPVAIAARAAVEVSRNAPLTAPTGKIERGQIRVVRAVPHEPAEPRLALVLSVDSRNEYVEILLVHSAPELATDVDLVVRRPVDGVPHDVVIQTDLRAVVWTLQLGGAVASLEPQTLAQLGTVTTAAAAYTTWTGFPLQGPADGRWAFKEREGNMLRSLAADCTSALLDHGMVWSADPRLLSPALLDLVDDPASLIEELMHWMRTRNTRIAAGDTAQIENLLDALDPGSWDQFADVAGAIADALGGLLLTAPSAGEEDQRAKGFVTSAVLAASSSADTYEVVHYVGHAVAAVR
jgi:hypothetical protein